MGEGTRKQFAFMVDCTVAPCAQHANCNGNFHWKHSRSLPSFVSSLVEETAPICSRHRAAANVAAVIAAPKDQITEQILSVCESARVRARNINLLAIRSKSV